MKFLAHRAESSSSLALRTVLTLAALHRLPICGSVIPPSFQAFDALSSLILGFPFHTKFLTIPVTSSITQSGVFIAEAMNCNWLNTCALTTVIFPIRERERIFQRFSFLLIACTTGSKFIFSILHIFFFSPKITPVILIYDVFFMSVFGALMPLRQRISHFSTFILSPENLPNCVSILIMLFTSSRSPSPTVTSSA